MLSDPEERAKIRAHHAKELRAWWQAEPAAEQMYRQATALMGHEATGCSWNGSRLCDAYWDEHHVRHVLGITSSLEWGIVLADLQLNHYLILADPCGDIDPSALTDTTPLVEYLVFDISMRGVIWLTQHYHAQPEKARAWWCDDCVCLGLSSTPCGKPTRVPLGIYCLDHDRRYDLLSE